MDRNTAMLLVFRELKAPRRRRGHKSSEDLRKAQVCYRNLLLELLDEPFWGGSRPRGVPGR